MYQLPIEPNAIFPFLLAVSLIELTPGPNMGYLAALSAAQGRVAGFRAVFGITLGLAFYMLLAVVGVAEIIATAPLAYGILRWAGVVYLFYLAWEAWRGARETSPGHAKDVDHAPFWRGLIANVLNPKALVFYVALLPGFIASDHAPFWLQALILGSLHLAISFGIHCLIVVGASQAGDIIAKSQHAVTVRQALAIGIALIAVWVAWETR
ncbi:MAG: LysE family translocator [Hyphomonadaceae bacterium]|nr:LysE family translocator [Hyphomonadaceae bacterium]MCA8885319.1 LysE family translocator [Hyphomonadaceae bacterium]